MPVQLYMQNSTMSVKEISWDVSALKILKLLMRSLSWWKNIVIHICRQFRQFILKIYSDSGGICITYKVYVS